MNAEVVGLEGYYFGMSKKELTSKISDFRKQCLHCEQYPTLVRRTLYATPHGDKPGAVLHSDYLRIRKGQYLLTIVDDFSRKTLLIHTNGPTAADVGIN